MKTKTLLAALLALGLLGGWAAVNTEIGFDPKPVLLASDDPCGPEDPPPDDDDGGDPADNMPSEIPA